jgi:hypothetical protein
MIRTRSALLLLGAMALFPAACAEESDSAPTGGEEEGGDGLTEEEQEFADAFAATLEDAENGFGVAAEDAQCMGDAVMVELGVEPFDDAGVDPGDIKADGDSPGALLGDGAIPREQAQAIVDSWEDCTDLVDMLIASAGSDLALDSTGEACFRAGLAEGDLVMQLLIGPFTSEDGDPDDETAAAFFALLEDCGSDEGGGPLVDIITDSLLEGSSFTEAQARCLAQGVVDELGADRMGELFGSGDFDDLDEAAQNEVTGALLQAASGCDVPLSAFG